MGELNIGDGLALSALVERLSSPGPADRAFVRGLALWFHARRGALSLSCVESLRLTSVTVTLQMTDRVRLMVAAQPPAGVPGEVLLTVDERDFPFVRVLPTSPAEAYEFCSLDYSLRGREVALSSGARGVLVASATIGRSEEHRVRLQSGQVVTAAGGSLTLLD